MKYTFMRVFGRNFNVILLRNVLDNMAEEEIHYWLAKCEKNQGVKAFALLFNVKKKRYNSIEKELVGKILLRAKENEWVYDII